MALGVDTNVLLRVIVADDPEQQKKAQAILDGADRIAIGVTCLCELAWVLSRAYRHSPASIAMVIRKILAIENVIVDSPMVDAGLKMLDAGGDFADGIIAFESRQLGGETFVSFDKNAVKLIKAHGADARQL